MRSQRVALKLGALREGVLRNRLVVHGQAHDAVVFSLIGSEWKPSEKLSPRTR
jgi:RimJ/RimL family protein N-acetyltransferase